ncbi:ion transporter [Maritimibacter sp. HL-12]|jgi:voltage-gated sodium channel|uniref:ion transporter n=1 Tax=Maritimibacter sp. HL-12 TaxID=1162418 RepID=UPI000A0EFFB7|nr:ion transporter [Maritimibacter sp. HL-12]SMH35479.1 voltage-gated sodium channel [Maritimibacter sp. HL-12]
MDKSNVEPQSADGDLRQIPPRQPGPLGKVQAVLESSWFQTAIIVLIMVNAITLGLETSPRVMALIGPQLLAFDKIVLGIFAAEVLTKLVVYRTRFHRDPWNLFDFIIVGVALMPSTGPLSVLRALRILRVLRLVSAVPSMRRVVVALLTSIPGISSIVGLLMLVFYVFAVMATKLFGASFPEFFGSIGASFYSLFQIMTLESWSMGIVRPVMEIYPFAWLYFVPFILVTSFTVLNLFIGIVVDAMQRQHAVEDAENTPEAASADAQAEILAELAALRREIGQLRHAKGD